MGKRGRKPVELGTLNAWEFEWYKALHVLRDDVQLPGMPLVDPDVARLAAHLTPRQIDGRISLVKRLAPEDIVAEWARRQGKPLEPESVYRDFAEQWKEEEILRLKGAKAEVVYKQAERRKIWDALVRARTLPALQKACDRWTHLSDVRRRGFSSFPAHVLANGRQFLFMKRNSRFSSSTYADDSRLEYLARGMAGVMMGISPMTAIERLRNMRHEPGGPLWSESSQCCQCWRCDMARQGETMKALGAVELPLAKEQSE